MAGSAVIGALRVVLGADTAAFESGLKGAQSRMDSFGSGMAVAGAAIGVAMAAAATALAASIKHAVDEADKLGKMAQKIGVPVEELSALKHAADLSGIGLEALEKSMGKLAKTMVEAAAKPTSEAANAFRALGVSVTNSDGTLKASSQVLSDVAGKFEGLKDGAGKTAVAMAIFGKSGKDMIPLLNSGRDGLQEMKDEAAKLGIVIDNQTAKSAEAFNDNLTRLGKVKDGIILKITAGMLPALENLSANMVRTAKDGDVLKAWGESIGGIFVSLFNNIQILSLGWQRLGVEWQAFVKFMQTPIFSGEIIANWKTFQEVGKESERQVEALRITLETAHLTDAFGTVGVKVVESSKALKEFNYQALGGKNALDKFIESTNKSLAVQQAELLTTGLATGAKERMRIELQALEIAQANHIKLTDAQKAKIDELAVRVEEMTLKLAGAALVQGAREPHEKFRDEIANNEKALIKFGATSEQIAAVQRKTAERYGATWGQVGSDAAGSFANMANAFGKENKTMAIAGKALAIVQATINAYLASSKAMASLPPPMSYIAAAAALAQGLATVWNIKSQTIPGMKTGGSFMIPGGFGGGDRMPVSFMGEPGERVTVEPIDGAQGTRGGGTREIIVRGVNPKDIFRGRDLIEIINAAVGDGSRVRFA